MKNQMFVALSLVLLSTSGAYGACTVGGHPIGPLPPASVTTDEEPILAGDALWAVTWITNHSQTPIDVYRELSNRRDLAPESLAGSNTTPPPPPPPPPNGGGSRCDSILVAVTPREAGRSSYVERTPIGPGLYRHLLELELKYIAGGIDPRTGANRHFPLVAWQVPMNDANVGRGEDAATSAVLRVDYVGLVPGLQSIHDLKVPSTGLAVYWNNALVRTYALKTSSPTIELKWSSSGEMLLNLDIGASPATEVRSLPLLSSVIANFQPTSFQIGRVPMPDAFVPAYGDFYVYSHLIESPASTGTAR